MLGSQGELIAFVEAKFKVYYLRLGYVILGFVLDVKVELCPFSFSTPDKYVST